MEVSGHPHVLAALSPGKCSPPPPVLWGMELVWTVVKIVLFALGITP